MKKITNKILALVTALALTLGLGVLVGCNANRARVDQRSAYEYSTLSAIGILAQTQSVAPLMLRSASPSETLDGTVRQEILDNLALVQNTLKGEVERSAVTASDREGYTHTYTLTARDVTGATKSYVFYYNEETWHEDKDEVETTFEGIVLADGVEYSVRGESESERDEQEQTLIVKKSATDYVVIEQESEHNEQSYSYTAYVNGRKVLESEVSYEIDRKGRVELEFSTEQNGQELEYSYEPFVKDGTDYIRVKIEREQGSSEHVQYALIRYATGENGEVVYELVN